MSHSSVVHQVSSPSRSLNYTCGPIDGSLYAVVQSSSSASAAATAAQPPASGQQANSPALTVSMDSGISSAPTQRFSPPTDSNHEAQIHSDLDKLLQDMMLTVEVRITSITSDRIQVLIAWID